MSRTKRAVGVLAAVAVVGPLAVLTGPSAGAAASEPGAASGGSTAYSVRAGGDEPVYTPRPDDPRKLRKAWHRWQALNEADYNTVVDRNCFCLDRRPIRTKVRDGEITSVTRVGKPGHQIDRRGWTMDRLFLMLRRAYHRADDVQARFDDRGVPHGIAIDYDRRAIDEEQYYSVKLRRK